MTREMVALCVRRSEKRRLDCVQASPLSFPANLIAVRCLGTGLLLLGSAACRLLPPQPDCSCAEQQAAQQRQDLLRTISTLTASRNRLGDLERERDRLAYALGQLAQDRKRLKERHEELTGTVREAAGDEAIEPGRAMPSRAGRRRAAGHGFGSCWQRRHDSVARRFPLDDPDGNGECLRPRPPTLVMHLTSGNDRETARSRVGAAVVNRW